MKIGLAIGKATHAVVVVGETETSQLYIANSEKGAKTLLELLSEKCLSQVTIGGNKRWGTPLAYYLSANGISIRYLNMKQERGARGKKGNISSSLINALRAGVNTFPFFKLQPTQDVGHEREEHKNVRLAREYLDACDKGRQIKHHLLDCLAVVFPECVPSKITEKRTKDGVIALPVPEPHPPSVFGKKMRPVLECPNPFMLENNETINEHIRALAKMSLGRSIPESDRLREIDAHRTFVKQYDEWMDIKEKKMVAIRYAVGNHPAVAEFGGGDSIFVVLALLGWTPWPHWRQLRRYAGLDVSCVDAKGRPRISRVRGEIRQYLYLAPMPSSR